MSASILILDDSPNRLRLFRRGLVGITAHLCSRADEALALLQEHHPRVVFLDYDLDQYGGAPNPGTGQDVVNWIVANADLWQETAFFIHSLNGPAGDQMAQSLRAARLRVRYYPRAWEHQGLLDFALAYAHGRPQLPTPPDPLGSPTTSRGTPCATPTMI